MATGKRARPAGVSVEHGSTDVEPEQLGLFAEPEHSAKPKRPGGPRSVAFGTCPSCTTGRIGLVRSASHLLWREHLIGTWSGARLPCRASNVAVCALPSLIVVGEAPPVCTCAMQR